VDSDKVKACSQESIVLVVVPYTFYDLSHSTSAIRDHIIKEVTRQGRIIFKDPGFVFQPGSYGTWGNTLDNYLGDQ